MLLARPRCLIALIVVISAPVRLSQIWRRHLPCCVHSYGSSPGHDSQSSAPLSIDPGVILVAT